MVARRRIDGRLMNDVSANDGHMAMVFHSYAQYPNMTACDDMAFALKRRGMPNGTRPSARVT